MGNLLKGIGGAVAVVGVFVALPYMILDVYEKVKKNKEEVNEEEAEEHDDAE